MAWAAITEADVLSEFTPDEATSLQTIQQGASNAPVDNLPLVLARTVAEVRDYIRSGGYALDTTSSSTLPLGLHSDVIAIARWRWLIAMPRLKTLETDVRERAFNRALKKLDLIAQGNFAVEPPASETTTGNRAGNWNSENPLLMRTHPVPSAASQYQPSQATDFANGNVPTLSPAPVAQQNGITAVPNGANSLAVVFPTAFTAAPSTVTVALMVPAGGALIECTPDWTTITANGFTVVFGVPMPSANYKLSWNALA